MTKQKGLFFLICILFVLSGVAALIYQVVWFKHLGYFLGNSTYSQAIVLATFMGGLALGNWWWGRKADKHPNPLRLFAFLEIGIGLYCVFYQKIFYGIEFLFTSTVQAFDWSSDSTFVLLLKLISSICAIITPTVMMGGTLPVLVRYFSSKIDEFGKNVAFLYFINSFGAVIGSALTGFYLLGKIGVKASTFLASGIDITIGIIFLFVVFKKRKKIVPSVHENEENSSNKSLQAISNRQQKIVLLTAGISGFSAMLYEVVWLRLLIPILGSTTYSFSIILTTFILGITIGSILVYFLFKKIGNLYRLLGICQIGIVLSILFSVPFYEKIPYYIWKAVDGQHDNVTDYQYYLCIQFIYVAILLILPTIFMGMSLPIASKLYVTKNNKGGALVGKIFGINTLGSVAGSLLTGIFFIPTIGILNSLLVGLSLNLILAFFILKQKEVLVRFYQVILLLALCISGIFYFSSVDKERWAYSIMVSETPRLINNKKAPKTFEKFLAEQVNREKKILFYEEGVGGTIVVCQKKNATFLFTNGKGDANSVGDIETQSSLGHIPMILHPNPDSVFVIGFGAGHTIGSVLTHPSVQYAQVAEISPEVIQAGEFFEHVNEKALKNKKLEVIEDDGITALKLSKKKFDIIISQPSNPWSAGVGNLFTKEFFAACKNKLKPGGYVAQWFGLYEMDERSLKMIFRTAYSEFNYISLWHIGPSDILLLCSDAPFNFDLESISQKFEKVKLNLSKPNIDIYKLPILLSLEIPINNSTIRNYAGQGPLNTENSPLLELWTPKAYFLDEKPKEFESIMNWSNALDSSSLLYKYKNNQSKKIISLDDRIAIASNKAGKFQRKNQVFKETILSLENGKNITINSPKDQNPQNIFHGWIDENSRFHPLDSIHPTQEIYTWTCCGTYKKDEKLNYQWISPSGKMYEKEIFQKPEWLTSWVPFDLVNRLEEGGWSLSVFNSMKKLILTDDFVVSNKAKLHQSKFNHSEILIGLHKGNDIITFDKVNPMQKLMLVTKGRAFGKREMINVAWTKPSGKKINQIIMYESNYEITWLYLDTNYPLEEGDWTVAVESISGEKYLETAFTVSQNQELYIP